MRGRFLALLVIAGLAIAATPARAEAPGATVSGDFNGDGIADAVVLGAVSPNLCSTVVQYGSAPGVFLPPIAFTYLRLGTGDDLRCPDIGVAFDYTADGLDDLALAWSQGAPPGLAFNRLIVTAPTFQPVGRFASPILRPTFLGAAVFAPGAGATPYTIGPGGFVSTLVQDGTLLPGPLRFCTEDVPGVQIIDLDQDGTAGAVLSYLDACADGASGVAWVRDGGAIARLEHDPTGETAWTARAVNADDDRFLDVRTVNRSTGQVSYFINTGPTNEFSLVRAPDANTDRAQLPAVKPLAIDVLANDHASRYVAVTISGQPRYGTVRVQSDRRIVYRPGPAHGRTDRFTYQLLEEGRRSSATVTIVFPPE